MTTTDHTAAEDSAIGMTVQAFEQLRARAHARTSRTSTLGQAETDVAALIDDRDVLLEKLAQEVGTVNVLVSWLRQVAMEPDLPLTDLPADVAVSGYAAPAPEMLTTEKLLHIVHRNQVALHDAGAERWPHPVLGDRAALVDARAPLAAQLLHAQARAETLTQWLASILNTGHPQPPGDS